MAVLIADADDLGPETARLTPVEHDEPEAVCRHVPNGRKPDANGRGRKTRVAGGRRSCCLDDGSALRLLMGYGIGTSRIAQPKQASDKPNMA